MSKHNSSRLNDMMTAKEALAKSRRAMSCVTEELIAHDILSSIRKMTEYGANEIWYTKYSYSKTKYLPAAEEGAIQILRSLGYGVTHMYMQRTNLNSGDWVLHIIW